MLPIHMAQGPAAAKVTLSSAQLLALHTTPMTIVPAPGAGKIIIPWGAIVEVSPVSSPYSDPNGTDLFWGGESGPTTAIIQALNNQFGSSMFALLTNPITGFPYAEPVVEIAFGLRGIPLHPADNSPPVLSEFSNKPIVLATPVANMTGGDGTAKLIVFYTTVPLS